MIWQLREFCLWFQESSTAKWKSAKPIEDKLDASAPSVFWQGLKWEVLALGGFGVWSKHFPSFGPAGTSAFIAGWRTSPQIRPLRGLQKGKARTHLLHRGSWNESFSSEELAIYTSHGAKNPSSIWIWKGYHFSAFLPVSSQATQKIKAEEQIEKLCLEQIFFENSKFSINLNLNLKQSIKKIILFFFQALYLLITFQSATKINPAKSWLLSLPHGPCLSHSWDQPWYQIAGSCVGTRQKIPPGIKEHPWDTLGEEVWGKHLEAKGLWIQSGAVSCVFMYVSLWHIESSSGGQGKKEKPGDKLHGLNCRSCNECWLPVNGSPLPGLCINHLWKRIAKPHYFQVVSEK